MIYFTSDLHLDHKRIIDYSQRPFKDVEEMNRAIIDNWNSVVTKDDTCYVLGDFALSNKAKITYFRSQLNGKIILIRGNHDRTISSMKSMGFDEVYNSLEIELDGYKIYLSHIPIIISKPDPRKYEPSLTPTPPKYYDYWLCGHVHEAWNRKNKIINVGVDASNFYPLTLEQLINRDI